MRYVYLFAHGDRHKIGSSRDPEERLLQAVPEGRLLHSFPSAYSYEVESALHRRFASSRAAGRGREWFHLTDEEVRAICQLGQTDAAADLPPFFQSPSTAVVRIDADLARMASIIATATGRDVAAVLSPLLRSQLEREYAKTVATLGQEIGKKKEGE